MYDMGRTPLPVMSRNKGSCASVSCERRRTLLQSLSCAKQDTLLGDEALPL
jgi:hypothetical protein